MEKNLALQKNQLLNATTRADLSGYPFAFQHDLRTLVDILQSYKVDKVILYGLLARGDASEESDVDICVEGLPEENFFVAYADCLLAAEHAISIIDLKSTYGHFRENILNDGVILYERQ